jgi:mercuric ion transport protein
MASPSARASITAGVLAAIGASICCVGPLALLGLGISGAWIGNLTALGVTILFFALAFRKLYLVPQNCAPGTPCANPAVARRQRAIFGVVSVLGLGLLAVPPLAPFFL